MVLEIKLLKLTGNVYRYMNENYLVNSYSVNGQSFTLECTLLPSGMPKQLRILKNECNEFLENFIRQDKRQFKEYFDSIKEEEDPAAVVNPAPAVNPKGTELVTAADSMNLKQLDGLNKDYKQTAIGLKAVLLNAIDKLDEDPKYIKQAQEINNVSKTLLEVYKTQLQIVKFKCAMK